MWEAAATQEGIEMFTGFDSSTGTRGCCSGAMAGTVLRIHRPSGASGVTADVRAPDRPDKRMVGAERDAAGCSA